MLAEIFARQSKLKGGQQKKVAIDALKLLTILQQGHVGSQGRLLGSGEGEHR